MSAQVNPVTFEVIWHRLMQLTEEMGLTYFRTSCSHVLITGTDASTAIMLADGSLTAVGPYIVTQANVLPLIVRSTLETCGDNPGINEGDIFICNDPYMGAIHQPDVATLTPVFYDDELVAWLGVSGHQVDNGGMDPGGFSIKAVEVHQEGLRIPPVKLVEGGRFREDILRWIGNQVRDELIVLDIRAQVAASNVGRERILKMMERYGVDTVLEVMRGAIDHAEERLRTRLCELTDGVWRAVQFIDHDGHEPNVYKIVCTLTKKEDHLTFDFTGTSPQARGLINATYSGMMAGVLSATYILLAYDMPWNHGILNCITIKSEEGTVNNCSYPAPCAMATISGVIGTIDAAWYCLTRMLASSDGYLHEAMANWTGSSMAPNFSGVSQHDYPFTHTEMSHFGGGGGARTYKDGVDTAGIVFNTTPNVPNIETIEQDFPILYLFRRQLTDSGGPGKFRGGMSGELAYVLHDAPTSQLEILFAGTGAYMPNAIGLSGGMPGAAIRVMRVLDADIPTLLEHQKSLPSNLSDVNGKLEVLPPKHERMPFGNASVWYHNWQGAAGYGDPINRDPEAVLDNVLDQVVSREEAYRLYGVVLSEAGDALDERATEARRREIRCERLGGRDPAPLTGKPSAPVDVIRVGEQLLVHPKSGKVWCQRCGHDYGVEDQDYRSAAVEAKLPLEHCGPIRGQDYGDPRFWLRALYCPSCGTQVEVEVGFEDAPEPYFRLGS